MSVSEFFSNTISYIGWTSTDFIQKWNKLSRGIIHPFSVFRRIWEGGYISESMHYAGIAADADEFPPSNEFPFHSPEHVALLPYGYPDIAFGEIGLFVLVMQDALSALGFCEGELDGFFGPYTLRALTRFRQLHNLESSNICDRTTWQALTFHACGCGVSPSCRYFLKSKTIL
ncbi:MAG: peptidoglycan-binding protein [Oscillospiraceae bacterium]|nr:peptidoglycan-binding protein [Oscillospiraceae bacterium]